MNNNTYANIEKLLAAIVTALGIAGCAVDRLLLDIEGAKSAGMDGAKAHSAAAAGSDDRGLVKLVD